MKAIYSDSGLDISDEGEQSKSSILSLELENIYKTLPEKDKKIFDLLSEGYSQQEIGNICNVNQKYIYRLKNKIKKQIMSDLT